MNAHRIQLKGPWEYEWLGATTVEPDPRPATHPDSTPSAAEPARSPDPSDQLGARRLGDVPRVHMPATWQSLFGDSPGTARFRRWFNQPTNLDADERVFVVFDGISGRARITLNAQFLGAVAGASCSAEFDVTALLASRNELAVDLTFAPDEHPEQPGGLWAPVALEIRREPA